MLWGISSVLWLADKENGMETDLFWNVDDWTVSCQSEQSNDEDDLQTASSLLMMQNAD